jgi:hypothetical protein
MNQLENFLMPNRIVNTHTRQISNQGMLMDTKQAGMIVAKGSTRNHVKGSSIDERFNDEISGSNRSTC